MSLYEYVLLYEFVPLYELDALLVPEASTWGPKGRKAASISNVFMINSKNNCQC